MTTNEKNLLKTSIAGLILGAILSIPLWMSGCSERVTPGPDQGTTGTETGAEECSAVLGPCIPGHQECCEGLICDLVCIPE